MPAVNRVVQFAEFGSPDVLRIVERPVPTPGEGQVLVRVRAAGANQVDAKVRTGLFSGGRPLASPLPVGIDLAGVVEDVGPGSVPAGVGDSVLGLAVGGAFADYALARHVVTKPADMPWAEAAAWPTVTEAAFRCLKQLQVQSGETLLVHGAAGSVGAVATQLAIAAGATVIGTAAPDQFDYLRGLGATAVRYGEGWSARVRDAAPGPLHAVLDTAGRGVLAESVQLVGRPERVITIADPDAAAHGVRFSGGSSSDRAYEAIGKIPQWWAAGIRVPVARTYPLTDVTTLFRDLESGLLRGKLIAIP
jgi:NADPH:quinone reductase-like Zn-dependent oxidoreductase